MRRIINRNQLFVFVFFLGCHGGTWLADAHPKRSWLIQQPRLWKTRALTFLRGGDDNNSDTEIAEVNPDHNDDLGSSSSESPSFKEVNVAYSEKKTRHSFDMILDLTHRSVVTFDEESQTFRDLVTTRSKDYLEDLWEARTSEQSSKLPHPRKLLHYLAPKVPAIKHSPDVNLRIHSARSDIDSGVAACIIGTLAHLCEVYDKQSVDGSSFSAAPELTTDRRFEQLVECVLSGVNVKKRKREWLLRTSQQKDDTEDVGDIEVVLDEEQSKVDDGIQTRDACRAAWGMSILGCHHLGTLGGESVQDVLIALSLRIRELLLARLQVLRQADLVTDASSSVSTEDRLTQLAEELAEDSVAAMWTFACVRACTGIRTVSLFEACCSILCQNPVEMRRRAQEAGVETSNTNVGTNDVIDKLARAEETLGQSGDISTTSKKRESNDKDVILDWLSPTEVNDVLWALALHGSSNATIAADENELSETASVLREIAFDRMNDWLEKDRVFHDLAKQKVAVPASGVQQDAIVEILDAATLGKANEQVQQQRVAPEMTEGGLALESNEPLVHTANVQNVEVVDAAALLASVDEGGSTNVETEVMVAPTTPSLEENFEEGKPADVQPAMLVHLDDTPYDAQQSTSSIFSPHDLASVAWAVTELRDPLRARIVGIVAEIFGSIGESSTDNLNGHDLSNLAWSLSKQELSQQDDDKTPPLPITLVQWIARSAFSKIPVGEENTSAGSLLHVLQPPELGRLLWAVAQIRASSPDQHQDLSKVKVVETLAEAALDAAGNNLALFATEDLVRVVWAYLELSSEKLQSPDVSVIILLGGILGTIEQSLHRWELGQCGSNHQESNAADNQKDSSMFSSFFGKSRTGILEQIISDHDAPEDADIPSHDKAHRPLLKDLTVDPATLCKAACAFERLRSQHPVWECGWTLTRVTLRLLASREARLMRECQFSDLVLICEAAARADSGSLERESTVGHFTHRVVQVMNELIDSWDKSGVSFSSFHSTTPQNVCTMIWALGSLGAKWTDADENGFRSAYKKMRVISRSPLLTTEEVDELSPSSTSKLLRGLVQMRCPASNRAFLVHVLERMKVVGKQLDCISTICDVMEAIALLKEDKSFFPVRSSDLYNPTDIKSDIDSEIVSSEQPLDPSDHTAEMEKHCHDILRMFSVQLLGKTSRLTGTQIRRLLSVFSLLPFQADEFVAALETIVTARSSQLQSSGDSLEVLLRLSKSSSATLHPLASREGSSTLEAVKKSLLSFLHHADVDKKFEEEGLSNEFVESIDRCVVSTKQASQLADAINDINGVGIDSIVRERTSASAMELGRCRELLANYHRIEFSTGERRSRYDKERRRDIAKRVLGRLIP